MPKLRPYTEKARAAKVIKSFVKHNMNMAAVARAEGVSQPAIAKRIKRPEVQKALSKINEEALRKAGASLTKIYSRAVEGLDATKIIPGMKIKLPATDQTEDINEDHGISAITTDVIDYKERRESVRLCLELTGRLRTANSSEDITKPTEIHIHYGHRRTTRVSAIRTE